MTKTVTVVGSLNIDVIMQIPRLPLQGETIATDRTSEALGGKGINQAAMPALLGAKSYIVGAVGNDKYGTKLMEALRTAGTDTKYVKTIPDVPTGAAYIMLEPSSHNTIVVAANANGCVSVDHIKQAAQTIQTSDVMVAQAETPIPPSVEAFKIARNANVLTILNPAPAGNGFPSELLTNTDVIVPNETEAQILTGIEVTDAASFEQAAKVFQEKHGVKHVIVTVGSNGSYYRLADGRTGHVPAMKVTAVDTTAAGDCFVGTLATKLNSDMNNIEEALKYATVAAGLAVQKMGSHPSLPMLAEVEAAMATYNH
eukprot:Protomagalhaensia_wolfi_Nauph_80__4415@NODE_451_length_2509_cov_61_359109_g339_i0_p1_GENE_NODE_451_length_2509_cov_61_359109_g339_i0NODE_451_length_2509_cov_61_359109_g339_i0_p1_ORF_typecomplete_len313_score56_64PfkB/PF00294_24/7e61Phos_pyr_kin/PF08543_12/2_9e03Phos_pyr_kin/PF08543_12/8_9e15OKR_DC_1_N/PF03709_15/1e04OKR_DC_1_N/PF03709_15/0_17Toprim_2/PF13155_6/5_3Toprim_2/PF13155_6/1_1e02T2SSG/PF08334_11/0_86T2SSG/PF08334_11/1e03_NODE_451_length_2509_cov_61_359109_g339_i01911129